MSLLSIQPTFPVRGGGGAPQAPAQTEAPSLRPYLTQQHIRRVLGAAARSHPQVPQIKARADLGSAPQYTSIQVAQTHGKRQNTPNESWDSEPLAFQSATERDGRLVIADGRRLSQLSTACGTTTATLLE
jgi:hypothetical protein